MMNVKKMLVLCAVLSLVLSCAAQANYVGTVDVAFTGFGASNTLTIWGGGREGLSVSSGQLSLNKTGDTGQGNLWGNGNIGAFCIDLAQNSSHSTLTYDIGTPAGGPIPTTFLGGPMGAAKADYLSELWGRFYDSSWVGSGTFTEQQRSSAAAFQACIWEIIYEDLPLSPSGWSISSDGTSGSRGFKATGLDTTLANSWLHGLDGIGPKANLAIFSNCSAQDYIMQSPVPEPTTIALLGLGGLILMRKRKSLTD